MPADFSVLHKKFSSSLSVESHVCCQSLSLSPSDKRANRYIHTAMWSLNIL